MAYGQKYLFRWESMHGVEFRIVLLQDGYSGSVIQRPLGGAPVLKMQQNDCVRGTSLEWKAECRVDGEFADLYTSSPREFAVELYRNSTKIWTGFITPELYSEPDIAPPYDVSLVATDGLGELKLYDYEKVGQQSIRSILQTILSKTGQDNEIYFVSQLRTSSVTDVNFLRLLEINLDFEEGETCYDVLQSVLSTLHATIALARGKWFVIRETDYEVSGTSIRAIAAGTRAMSSETTVTDAIYSIGQMGVADLWPVGYSSTRIVPAKKKVIVEAPWHPSNGVVNGDFASASGWTRPTNPRSESTSYVAGIPAMHLGPSGSSTELYQELSLRGISAPISLKVSASRSGRGRTGGALNIYLTYEDVNDVVYYLAEIDDSEGNKVLDWTTTDPEEATVRKGLTSATSIKADADTIEVTVPPLPAGVGSGSLKIDFSGSYVYVFSVEATVVLGKGYRDTINIDNGARGEGDSVEILTGYTPEDVSDFLPFLQGILLYSDAAISTFSDGCFSDLDFLALTSRGYALSVALPRLSTQGHFNMPATKTYPPLLIDHSGIRMAVQTYSWDLFEEEIDMVALSLPAASLTVEDETVESMGDAEISQSGSSSSSGGGGGGSTGGVSSVQVRDQYGSTQTKTPDSSGKVTLPNYPQMLRNPAALSLKETSSSTAIKEYTGDTAVDITGDDLASALGSSRYATQAGLNLVRGDVETLQQDLEDLDDQINGDDGLAEQVAAMVPGTVVNWGTTGTYTQGLVVAGTSKTLVTVAGYNALDDRVSYLENNPGGSSISIRVKNSSGTDGTYTPVNGVITLPNYPTMLRNPNSLILAKTQNGTVIKEYNGEQGVTFTAADLAAALDGVFVTTTALEDYVTSSDLETALEDYVNTGNDVQQITGFKKFIGGLGLASGATASSGLRIKVVNSTINGVTKSRIHIYGDVVIHGEVASGDSNNNND